MALIRYYLGTNPTTAEEFARDWGHLYYALQFDNKIKVEEKKKG
jgi:hypothetical protein